MGGSTLRRKMICLALCAAFFLAAVMPAAALDSGFSDVNSSDWFCGAVIFAHEKGLMNGTGGSWFEPYAPTTRGMIVTILHRIAGEPAPGGACLFSDVTAGSYYSQAIAWAAENRIVTGYSAADFGPDDSITREQLATILCRYAAYKKYDVSGKADLGAFTDSGDISGFAADSLSWANAEGLITGTDTDTLEPKGNAVRAQAAEILMRFCTGVAAESGKTHLVRFLMNDGTGTVYASVTTSSDGKAVRPADPERSGYIFSGWFADAGCTKPFSADEIVGADLSLYASWTAKSSGSGQTGTGTQSGTDEKKAVPADSVEGSAGANLFIVSASAADDGKTVEVTVELKGTVALCGFDMGLLYDSARYSLKELDSNLDLQLFAHDDGAGRISFNYASVKNITGSKTILKALFSVSDGAQGASRFSLEPAEVIQTVGTGTDIAEAPYTVTYASVSPGGAK